MTAHQISGRLSHAGAMATMESGRRHIVAGGEAVFDLKEVSECDSTAVCVLLDWLRTAQANTCTLRFINVPERILELAGLYGVASLLPIGDEKPGENSSAN